MHDPLLSWREEFPTLSHTVHMISHSLGAMPRRTRDRLAQFADEWSDRSIRAWAEGWWEMPITVGNMIGEIIDAPKGSIVMHQNVSICQQVVLSALDCSAVIVLAARSRNLFAIDQSLLHQLFQVDRVELLRKRNVDFIPAIISLL